MLVGQALGTALHVLGHTAHMRIAQEQRQNHPRTAEYARQLRIYRGQWAALEDDEKRQVADLLLADPLAGPAGLNEQTVAAAIAALEA